jgi:myo-inositol-1(or 4)-monophosphatase
VLSDKELGRLCIDVCETAREAGAFIRKEAAGFDSNNIEYKGKNDLVSYVDKQSEILIVKQLGTLLPGSVFLTEENTVQAKSGDFMWIIDPLDGTTNFIHGMPCYCVSIALLYNNMPVIGVVYEVNFDECFYAWKNGGSYLNGNRIFTSRTANLSSALLATGFPYSNYDRLSEYMGVFDYCLKNTHGLRRLGSAAADLAYVAAGRLDGFYEYGLNAWDVAAGVILVKEADGVLSDFSGGENYIFGKEIVATNRMIFQKFSEVINRYFYADGA